jgi:Carboxypeptidase regulatory-like domain
MLSGAVSDPSSAVVPPAVVTDVEVGPEVSRTAISAAEGLYVLSSLRPTTHESTVEAPGFSTFTETGIALLTDESG